MDRSEEQGSYGGLLFDRRWKAKRESILRRDGYKCRICGSEENLVVHHKQYHFSLRKNRKCDPWEYDDRYLITLCEKCHSKGHSKFTIPMKNINR